MPTWPTVCPICQDASKDCYITDKYKRGCEGCLKALHLTPKKKINSTR